MKVSYDSNGDFVITASGPNGMRAVTTSYTTAIFEDAFGKYEVIITLSPSVELETKVHITRVHMAGGMDVHSILVHHSPNMQADVIQEIIDAINTVIADF